MKFINLSNEMIQGKLIAEVTSGIAQEAVAFSSITDKGREFTGMDFRHFVHEIVPTVVKWAIEKTLKEEE